MARTIVTPCQHRFRLLETVRIMHKGRTHSSETVRDRYICSDCTLTVMRMPAKTTGKPKREPR